METEVRMTTEEHRARHQLLHGYFDELMADFFRHKGDGGKATKATIGELLAWSHRQTWVPDEEGQ